MPDVFDVRLVVLKALNAKEYVTGSPTVGERAGAAELAGLLPAWVRDCMVVEVKGGRSWGMRTLPAQIMIDTHGHVELLLAEDGGGADWARAIVTEVTRRALHEAPGLQVVGWSSEKFDLGGDASALAAARARGEAELPQVAARLPGPASRFQQLPIVQIAADGLPAADFR